MRRLERLFASLAALALLLPAAPAQAAPGNCGKSNGCGSEATAKAVRDRWGPIDFKPACDAHDACYGTRGRTQDQCDDAFFHDMRHACERAYIGFEPSALKRQAVNDCKVGAFEYYAGVWLFGGDSYDEAQVCIQDGMRREEASIRAFINELRTRVHEKRSDGAVARAVGERLKPYPAAEQARSTEQLEALLDAKNEVGVYLVTARAARTEGLSADQLRAHNRQVAELESAFKKLQGIHARAEAAVAVARTAFHQATFEAKVEREAARFYGARLDAIDKELVHAHTVLGKARVGVQTTPNQKLMDQAAKIMATSDARLSSLISFVQGSTAKSCAPELAPLRTARAATRSAQATAAPIYLKALQLVGKGPVGGSAPRPPPPPR